MAGIKKLRANPAHLNNFMSSDVRSGNNPCGPSPAGQGHTSVGTKYMDWPYDPASNKDGSLTHPAPNPVRTSQVGHTQLNTGLTG